MKICIGYVVFWDVFNVYFLINFVIIFGFIVYGYKYIFKGDLKSNLLIWWCFLKLIIIKADKGERDLMINLV